jgi:hypothetical protein
MPYREELDAAVAQLDAMTESLAARDRAIGALRAKLADAESKKTKAPARACQSHPLAEALGATFIVLGMFLLFAWSLSTCAGGPEPSGYVDYCTAQDCTDFDCEDASCAMTCLYGRGAGSKITYGRFDTLEKAVDAAEALGCPVRVTKGTKR